MNTEQVQRLGLEWMSEYKEQLVDLMEAVKSGNTENIDEKLENFQRILNPFYGKEYDYRQTLTVYNNMCHVAAMETSVSPAHVLGLFREMQDEIDSSRDAGCVQELTKKITHGYCSIVKKYAYPEYSALVRAVINYISTHLEEELSLATIAAHFGKNTTVLSAMFSEEVGCGISDCIRSARIHEAQRCFRETNMSVSEVAVAVGFKDFSHFSRVFKKITGMTPREYKSRK